MFRIRFTVVSPKGEGGPEILESMTEEFAQQLSDLTPLFERIGSEVFEPAIAQQFGSQGAYFGTPWPPLSETTIREREQRGRGGHRDHRPSQGMLRGFSKKDLRAGMQILGGGPLEASFRRGEAGHYEEIIGGKEYRWGSNLTASRTGVGLAKVHHFGAPSRHLPSRPIIGMNQEMMTAINSMGNEFVGKAAEQAGFGQMEMFG